MTPPNENTGRISALLREHDLDWLVFSSFDGVCFATGHVCGIETGPSPFSDGPTLAFVGRDGSAGIVCSNTEAQQAGDALYERYEGFSGQRVDQSGNYRSSIRRLMKQLGISGRIGVETITVPSVLAELLPADLTPLPLPLARLRAVKTSQEINRLRQAGAVAAIGQARAREVSRSGASELSAFGAVRSAMEVAAGERCAVAGEYLAGRDRTATLGLQPSGYELHRGDPVICDLAPRVNGYWGDSCGSFAVEAAPSEAYLRLWTAARETLDLAVSELRPGLKVSAFDQMLRADMARRGYAYPHHSGHGIGTSVHEFPRLVPNEHALIEQDMVLMVEPGAYLPDVGGVRCEFMLRVLANGAEILTDFQMTPVVGDDPEDA